MKLLFLENMVSEHFIKAVCLTFLHSLWQGLLIGILVYLCLRLTRSSTSALRYGILTGAFFLFVLSASITLCIHFDRAATGTAQLLPADPGPAPAIPVAKAGLSFTSIVISWCQNHANRIMAIWLVIFLFRALQMTKSLVSLGYLRNYKVFTVSTSWQERLDGLSVRVGLQSPVRLRESGIVEQPLVIGILKPVILIPLGFFLHLPPEQAEAILLHELAHIKRRDYLVNLLQSITEIIFFFNPALLWLSALIRKERENCCDDIAVDKTGNKKTFIKALVSFQEYQVAHFPLAMQLTGNRNPLPARVHRIIYHKRKKLNGIEKISFGCCIVIMITLALSYSTTCIVKGRASNAITKTKETTPDGAPAKTKTAPLPVQEDKPYPAQYIPATKNIQQFRETRSVPDTIPEGVSEEFIKGYQAAVRYRSQMPAAVTKKEQIETAALSRRIYLNQGDHKQQEKTTDHLQEALYKKQTEQSLQGRTLTN